MVDTEVGEDTAKNVRCELGDDLHTDTDTDRIADWGIEDVLNIFKRIERNLGKRDERTEKIEFRDDTQVTEECFKCLKMCEEAERKNLDGIGRRVVKYGVVKDTSVSGSFQVRCIIKFDEPVEVGELESLGYKIGAKAEVLFNSQLKKDGSQNKQKCLQAIICKMTLKEEHPTIGSLQLKLNFITETSNELRSFTKHMSAFWKNCVGQQFLSLILNQDKKGDVPEVDYSHLPPPVLEGLQLNKEQSDAFHMSLAGFPVTYIQAPCGTGKTVVAGVIANSVDQIVFLTAETNKSVDNLAESAHKQSLGSRNVIRYYSPGHEMTLKETLQVSEANISKSLLSRYFDKLSEKEKVSLTDLYEGTQALEEYDIRVQLGDKTMRKFRSILKELEVIKNRILIKYHSPQMIAATSNYGVGTLEGKMKKSTISRVIVDEGSQMTLCKFLYMASTFPNATSFLIIGDTNQLPPFINKECEETGISNFFNQSVLHFIQRSVPFKNLRVSYRMHSKILDIVSTSFYNKQLICGVRRGERDLVLTNLNLPSSKYPFAWIETDGSEMTSSLGTSFANVQEAVYARDFVHQLLERGFAPHQIGIICMYRGQVGCLRKMMKNSRISINTVDGIQGDEKDVILLCTTKTAKYGDQICSDFIKNPKRINVALSRARSGLFIFGDITYLENSSEWKYIVHHFKVRKAIIKPENIKKMFVVQK
uniref:DNA helicase n=1 Tax=Rhabditophanes sp. KR3021 TaxID=114890 RepID=A0AC35UDV8_9BILA